MSHETIVFGYIESSTYTVEDYRKLQEKNIEYLAILPEEFDEYPGFSKGMFSWPPFDSRRGCFRAHVIHFGGSYKHIDQGYSDIRILIGKFEAILKNLHWFNSSIYFQTELVGNLRFEYRASGSIVETYRIKNPQPTANWKRLFFQNERESEFKT